MNRARWPRSNTDPFEKLASLAAWGLRSHGPGGAELAARAPAAGRSRLAQFALGGESACPALRGCPRANPRRSQRRASLGRDGLAGVVSDSASGEPEPFVLFVGRIEPRKNTLGLIRAIRRLGLPLVVIGEAPPGCRGLRTGMPRAREATASRGSGGSTITIRCWPRRMPRPRVFALPSWFETPGLAALEAGLAGCSIAITPYGSTRDYFGDLVEYARPDRAGGDPASRDEMLG